MSKYKKWRYTIQNVKSTAQLLFKIDFQKVDQHAGGKWLIHDTKRRKDNQLQSLKLLCRISKLSRCDIKGSDGTMLNPIFWKKVQGQKHPSRWGIVEHQTPSIKVLFNPKEHSWGRGISSNREANTKGWLTKLHVFLKNIVAPNYAGCTL